MDSRLARNEIVGELPLEAWAPAMETVSHSKKSLPPAGD
jgi:hypothetical protein